MSHQAGDRPAAAQGPEIATPSFPTPSHYEAISCDLEEGSAEGYAVGTGCENLENWLLERHRIGKPELVAELRDKFQRIALLNNLNVEEAFRGRGLGNELLEEFMGKATDAGVQAILLMADLHEIQTPGFVLTDWYRGYGFEVLCETSGGPVMLLVL